MSSGQKGIAATEISSKGLLMLPPKSKPVVKNLRRLMKVRGLSAAELSRLAGFSRTYVGEILAGRNQNPGSAAVKNLAAVLGCAQEDILNDAEPEPSDAEHQRLNRERALRAAERSLGPEAAKEGGSALVFRAANLIYDVLVERERALGRSLTDSDDDFWGVVDSIIRRWLASSK